MPDDNAAILARIDTRLESIDKHLDKLNGRTSRVEDRARDNEKAIAVISTTCRYVTHNQEDDIQRIDNKSQRTSDDMKDFVKKYGVQGGILGTLVVIFGKISGWW